MTKIELVKLVAERTGIDQPTALAAVEGVIDVVPPEEAVKWFRDLHKVFARHGIAHAMWSWKQMDFGLIDERMDGVRDELLTLL